MTRVDYIAAREQLRAEGFPDETIDNAFRDLSEAGMQANDEDGPLGNDELTPDEYKTVRECCLRARAAGIDNGG